MKTRVIPGAFISVATLLVGCPTQSQQPCDIGIFCSKCKIVLVQSTDVKQASKSAPITQEKTNKAHCSNCESIAETFFKTGQLKLHCPSCGGMLTHCNLRSVPATAK